MSTMRDLATVTVSKPVDGLPHRKRTGGNTMSPPIEYARVTPALLVAARRALRPGQKLVIESATCVRLVNRREVRR